MENELKYKIKGRDFLTGLPRSADVSTNEVLKAIEGELRDIMKTIKTVLQDTPPELASDIIDQGISMSGGGSLLRNICELVYQSTGVKAQLVEDPLLAVARGTGIALEHLDSYKRSIISKP